MQELLIEELEERLETVEFGAAAAGSICRDSENVVAH